MDVYMENRTGYPLSDWPGPLTENHTIHHRHMYKKHISSITFLDEGQKLEFTCKLITIFLNMIFLANKAKKEFSSVLSTAKAQYA
jgi:hypothetical protein